MTTPARWPQQDGAVLVRLRAQRPDWAADLPVAPAGQVLTVTVGDRSLLSIPIDDLVSAGYRIVGVAGDQRAVGSCIDVYVPAQLRDREPDWWARLLGRAERVFDLRMGPVRAVLGPQLELHLAASD